MIKKVAVLLALVNCLIPSPSISVGQHERSERHRRIVGKFLSLTEAKAMASQNSLQFVMKNHRYLIGQSLNSIRHVHPFSIEKNSFSLLGNQILWKHEWLLPWEVGCLFDLICDYISIEGADTKVQDILEHFSGDWCVQVICSNRDRIYFLLIFLRTLEYQSQT